MPAREQCGGKGQQQGDQADAGHVAHQDLGWHFADQINIGRQEACSEKLLDCRHDHVQVDGNQRTADHARERADAAGNGTLHHENLHDRAGRGTQCAQDGDIGLLVGDDHHQRRDQIERSHGHNQGQDDEHHAFFDFHSAEIARVFLRPVRDIEIRHLFAQLHANAAGMIQVVELEAYATDGIPQAKQPLGIVDVQECQAGVIRIIFGTENADDGELLQAWNHAGWRHLALRCNQGDLVANPYTQLVGQLPADNRTEFAGLQLIQAANHQFLCHFVDAAFLGRINAPHQGTPDLFAIGQQALAMDVWRNRLYLRCAGSDARDRLPIIQHAGGAGNLNVGGHAKNAVANFFLETVHDREHDDQCRHAQCDADNRNHRNERDETVAALGADIAQANEKFVHNGLHNAEAAV